MTPNLCIYGQLTLDSVDHRIRRGEEEKREEEREEEEEREDEKEEEEGEEEEREKEEEEEEERCVNKIATISVSMDMSMKRGEISQGLIPRQRTLNCWKEN